MATDKSGYPHYYFSTKTCCGYSLEAPHRGTSNEYPQHTFIWRIKKISIFRMKKSALSVAMGKYGIFRHAPPEASDQHSLSRLYSLVDAFDFLRAPIKH